MQKAGKGEGKFCFHVKAPSADNDDNDDNDGARRQEGREGYVKEQEDYESGG